MKKLIYILIVILSFSLKAQDVHFSHIHASPIFLNPSMTGVFNQDIRLITNYKNQWISSGANFNTLAFSVDGKLFSFSKFAHLNLGLLAFTDAAGDLNYRQSNVQLPISVSTYFSKKNNKNKHLLSLGIQNGFFQQSADLSQIIAFDNEPLVGSLFSVNKTVYDFSYGLLWTSIFDQKNSFYLGYSHFHLNGPKVNSSPFNDIDRLHEKYIIHGGGEFVFKNELFALLPSFISMNQGPHREITSGTFFKQKLNSKVKNKDENAFYYGLWTRWYFNTKYQSGFDALITTFRYDHNQLSISFSYDITLSKLTVANRANGGAELSLIYLIDIKKKTKTNRVVYCPKF